MAVAMPDKIDQIVLFQYHHMVSRADMEHMLIMPAEHNFQVNDTATRKSYLLLAVVREQAVILFFLLLASLRDTAVVACCILWEHTSLKAFWHLAKNWKRVLAKRRVIQARRCVDDEYIASWFRYSPVSLQVPERATAVGQTVRTESGASRMRDR